MRFSFAVGGPAGSYVVVSGQYVAIINDFAGAVTMAGPSAWPKGGETAHLRAGAATLVL